MGDTSTTVVAVISLREFFHDSMQEALQHRGVCIDDQTEHYVVNVLTTFAQADALFEYTASGTRLKPLALMFAEALEAPTADVRYQLLRRLGDISLFVAGFLAESFARKPIDIDYLCAQRKGHPSPLRGVAEDRKPPGA